MYYENIDNENTKHVYISHHSESKQLRSEIKERLESLGNKVWKLVATHKVDSMAECIDSALCVLICVAEKYKQSKNCKLEAEYVMKLEKPFVALIMQKSYKPNLYNFIRIFYLID
jgi:hypothetical protein